MRAHYTKAITLAAASHVNYRPQRDAFAAFTSIALITGLVLRQTILSNINIDIDIRLSTPKHILSSPLHRLPCCEPDLHARRPRSAPSLDRQQPLHYTATTFKDNPK